MLSQVEQPAHTSFILSFLSIVLRVNHIVAVGAAVAICTKKSAILTDSDSQTDQPAIILIIQSIKPQHTYTILWVLTWFDGGLQQDNRHENEPYHHQKRILINYHKFQKNHLEREKN